MGVMSSTCYYNLENLKVLDSFIMQRDLDSQNSINTNFFFHFQTHLVLVCAESLTAAKEPSSIPHTRLPHLSLSAPTTPTFIPTAKINSAPEAKRVRPPPNSPTSGIPRRSRVRQFRPNQDQEPFTTPRMQYDRVIIAPNSSPPGALEHGTPEWEGFGLRNVGREKFKIQKNFKGGYREGKEIELSERPIRVSVGMSNKKSADSGSSFPFENVDGKNSELGTLQPQILGQGNAGVQNAQPLLEIPNNGIIPTQESVITSTERTTYRRPSSRNPANVLRTRNSNRFRKGGRAMSENSLSQIGSFQTTVNNNNDPHRVIPNTSQEGVLNTLPNRPVIETSTQQHPSVPPQDQPRSFLLSTGRQRWLVQTTGQDQTVVSPRDQNIPNLNDLTKRRRLKMRRKEENFSNNESDNQARQIPNNNELTTQEESIPLPQSSTLPDNPHQEATLDSHQNEPKLYSNQAQPIRLRPTEPIFLDPTEFSQLRQQIAVSPLTNPSQNVQSSQDVSPISSQNVLSSQSQFTNPRPLQSSFPQTTPSSSENSIRSSPKSSSPSFGTGHFPSLYSNSVFGSVDSSSSTQINDLVSRDSPSLISPPKAQVFSHGFHESKFVNFPRSFDPAPKVPVSQSHIPNLGVGSGSFSSISNTSRIYPTSFSGTNAGFANLNNNSQFNTQNLYSSNASSKQTPDYSTVNVNTQFRNPISYFNNPSRVAQNPDFKTSVFLPAKKQTLESPTQFERISFPLAPSQVLPFPSRIPSSNGVRGQSDVITASDVYYPVYGTLYMTDKNSPNVTSRIDFIQTVPSGSYSKFNL